MSILAKHEAKYFIENHKVPEETNIVWQYSSGKSLYNLHMGHDMEGKGTMFFISPSSKDLVKDTSIYKFDTV